MLRKNEIEAWLQDEDGNILRHSRPTIQQNEVNTVVTIAGSKASHFTPPVKL
jgi:hypothetical protein